MISAWERFAHAVGYELSEINWTALSELYRMAPLGNKKPGEWQLAFSSGLYTLLRAGEWVIDRRRTSWPTASTALISAISPCMPSSRDQSRS